MQLGEMRKAYCEPGGKGSGSEQGNGFTKTVDPLQGEKTILGHNLQAQHGLGPCHVREWQRTLGSPWIQL